jgi:hypothetical protein
LSRGLAGGIERTRIADAPVQGVQLGIERAGDPGRAAPILPGVSRPGVTAGLARSGDLVGAPQMLTPLGIPAIDEGSGLEVDRVLAPQFLAGLGIERDDGVERGAEDLAVIDGGAAGMIPQQTMRGVSGGYSTMVFQSCLPGLGVDRHRGAVGGASTPL